MEVDVIYSPALVPFSNINTQTVVVVVDVFRATSLIVTAFSCGIKEVIPFTDIALAKEYKQTGYLLAGERNARKIEGFDFGNSPLELRSKDLSHEKLAVTTTNGTKAIEVSKHGKELWIGAFLNISTIEDQLVAKHPSHLIILCAGWKNKFNIEDALFAGELASRLDKKMDIECTDSALFAKNSHNAFGSELSLLVNDSSHRKRLKNLNMEDDIHYCLQKDYVDYIPKFKEGKLV